MTKKMWFGILFILVVILVGAASVALAQTETTSASTSPVSTQELDLQTIMQSDAVTVTKVADPPILDPDGDPWVTYVVTFTNNFTGPVTLEGITDTLPSGFQFIGMGPGCDPQIGSPVDPHSATLVWQGPFTVPVSETLRLCYIVQAVLAPGYHANMVESVVNGSLAVSTASTVTVPGAALTISKDATPKSVTLGQLVTYDVTFVNTSNVQSAVSVISDTLPNGFAFERMDPTSDVTEGPDGDTGTIVWTGPFAVPASSEIHLIYQVRTYGVGDSTNSVVARDAGDNLLGPAESPISITPVRVYLPLMESNHPPYVPPPYLLDEDFTAGVPVQWTPFVNLPGLLPSHWFWRGDGETWGRYDYDPGKAVQQWALSMYLDEGVPEWTDYTIKATMRGGKLTETPLVGIWFRGTHQLRTDQQGGDVTGYIFCMQFYGRAWRNRISLGRINPAARTLNDITWLEQYNFPYTKIWQWYDIEIKVEGSHIQIWIDGAPKFDLYDATWSQGTVGFVVFDGSAGFDDIRVTPLNE